MDLYKQLGTELRSLFKEVFNPKKGEEARMKMGHIVELAGQIGDPIYTEAQELSMDVLNFLEKPTDPKLLKVLKKHALRLEQETREL